LPVGTLDDKSSSLSGSAITCGKRIVNFVPLPNRLFSKLRVFFQYLLRQGIRQQSPLQDMPALSEWHYLPFVFSPDQTDLR